MFQMHFLSVCLMFQIVPIVGGMAVQKQTRLLKRKPDIIVATPGRLWELVQTVGFCFFVVKIYQLVYATLYTK